MRVSYVMPSFNQGRYIRKSIDSCLAQGVEPFELIVMDGGSTDETVDILQSYGDQITWVSEQDDGQSDAINKGIERATGDVICWLNSDDYYTERAVQAAMQVFDSHPEVGLVHGRGMMVTPSGEPYCEVRTMPLASPAELIVHAGNVIFQPAAFFRRSLFLEVGMLDTSLHYAMDLDLWLRMLPRTQCRFLDQHLANATTHEDAKTRTALKKMHAEIEVCKARHAASMHLTLTQQLRRHYGKLRQNLYAQLVTRGWRRLPGE